MSNWRRRVGVAGVLLVAIMASASAQTSAPAPSQSQAASQADNPTAGARVKNWTRSKLDAAKKRWGENQEKFAGCQKQLGEKQKVKRLSLHNQGHFLQDCMSRKP